jgi:hypothetical protein
MEARAMRREQKHIRPLRPALIGCASENRIIKNLGFLFFLKHQ